jgi:hypothetical protein
MTSPEPLRGAAPRSRPARVLGSDEVDALVAAEDKRDDEELDDTGEWELDDDHRPD